MRNRLFQRALFAAVLLLAPSAFAQSLTGFGSKGGLAISNDANLAIGYVNIGGDSNFVLQVAPAVDYFIVDHVSLGGQAIISYTHYEKDRTGVGVGPRIGFAVPVGERVSLWPRLGISLATSNTFQSYGGLGSQNSGLSVNVDMPILYHPTTHFFLGLGPNVHAQLTGDEPKLVTVLLSFTVGGWF